jgi:hypothetical protein
MVKAEDLLIFKLREKGKGAKAEPKAEAAPLQKPQVVEAPAAASAAEQPVKANSGGFSLARIFRLEKEEVTQPIEQKVEASTYTAPAVRAQIALERFERVKGREREEAKGKFCEWHPWRPAYATCDFCHRPFCYEDTVEFGKEYYCLEDIDKVSDNYAQELYANYSGISFISAGLFMLAFIAFVFFASGQLVYIFTSITTTGLPVFLANLNYSYVSALLGLMVSGTGIISAMFILIQSDKGFAVGLLAGLAETALFSYQFLSSGLIYMAMISAMGLAALMLLAYSRVSYEVPEQIASEQSIYRSTVVVGGNSSGALSF